MLKRVSTRNLLISAAAFAGIAIIAILNLLYSWETEKFALQIQTQTDLNRKSFQIALESEFQKNQTRAQLLGEVEGLGDYLSEYLKEKDLALNAEAASLRKLLCRFGRRCLRTKYNQN